MKINILICCSGSVATIKLPEIILNLLNFSNILLITTNNSNYFLNKLNNYNKEIFEKFNQIISLNDILLTDSHEWYSYFFPSLFISFDFFLFI